MNKNVFNIMFAVIAGMLALAVVIQCFRLSGMKKDLELSNEKLEVVEAALRNSEAENQKLRELITRANNALEEGLKQVEEAKKVNDQRMDKIDDAPSDWLQCPLPDDVREAFGAYCYSDAGNEAAERVTRAM